MSDVRKDVGIVTAYGYAVEGGYQGTEAQYTELMGSIANIAQEATDAKTAAETAQGKAEDAQEAAETAQGKAEDAQNAAERAQGLADDAKSAANDSATSASESVLKAEGFAVGEQNEEEVGSDSPYYHNNAKYYSEEAGDSATQAAASAATSAAMTGLAPQFDSTTAYASGDYALYNGTLYKFTASHPAGAWTGTDAVAVTLAPEVSDLKSHLKQVSDVIVDGGDIDSELTFTLVNGEALQSTTGNVISLTGYSRTDYIAVESNTERVTLKWTNSVTYNLNALCFFDDNKTFVSGKQTPLTSEEESKTHDVPKNAKYVMFSGNSDSMSSVRFICRRKSAIDDLAYEKAEKGIAFVGPYVKTPSLLQNIIGVVKYPNNLVDYSECVDNEYVGSANGVFVKGQPNYFRTGYVPVEAGETYKSNIGRNWAWYDSSFAYITGDTGTDIQSGITAPNNASYIAFTINKTSDGTSNPFDLYFANVQNFDLSVIIPDIVASGVIPWCYGKKINWIGDSIVDGQDFDEEVCSALGLIKPTEYGINGSTIALSASGADGRNALCVRYANMSNDADLIAVSCGTNDFEYAWCPIGTIDDPDDGTSNNTFYGALKTLCKGLIDKYPQKVIFFTTPIKRGQAFANGDGGEYTADGVPTTPFSKNKYGKTLMDYADIIKEVCGYYSIPVLDMYRESLLNPHITAQQSMFDSALTHPTVTGQRIMARRVCGWLTQLGYTISGLS